MSKIFFRTKKEERVVTTINYAALLCCMYTIIFVFGCSIPVVAAGRHRQPKEEEDRIVGGTDAPEDRYPTITILSDKYGNFVCAGSLILPNVVLSAAHCTNYVEIAQLGVYNRLLASFTPAKVETFTIIEKIVHPRYIMTESDCDFVLLKLSGSSKSIAPITLNDNPNTPAAGATVTAIGWGATSEGGSTSYKLREVNLSVVSQSQCQLIYGPTVTDNMICAGGEGKDACQGDSGGPLYITGKTSAQDLLVGVVSWGNGCARAGYPGVYARVASSEAMSWIKETACSLSRLDSCSLRLSNYTTSTPNTNGNHLSDNQPTPSPSETYSSSSSPSDINDDVSNGLNQPIPSSSSTFAQTVSPSISPPPTPQPTTTTNFYDSIICYWQATVDWFQNLW